MLAPYNFDYKIADNAPSLHIIQVFSDTQHTYIQSAEDKELSHILADADNGVIPFEKEGSYIKMKGIFPSFSLHAQDGSTITVTKVM